MPQLTQREVRILRLAMANLALDRILITPARIRMLVDDKVNYENKSLHNVPKEAIDLISRMTQDIENRGIRRFAFWTEPGEGMTYIARENPAEDSLADLLRIMQPKFIFRLDDRVRVAYSDDDGWSGPDMYYFEGTIKRIDAHRIQPYGVEVYRVAPKAGNRHHTEGLLERFYVGKITYWKEQFLALTENEAETATMEDIGSEN